MPWTYTERNNKRAEKKTISVSVHALWGITTQTKVFKSVLANLARVGGQESIVNGYSTQISVPDGTIQTQEESA